jgi:hypothetical protein
MMESGSMQRHEGGGRGECVMEATSRMSASRQTRWLAEGYGEDIYGDDMYGEDTDSHL